MTIRQLDAPCWEIEGADEDTHYSTRDDALDAHDDCDDDEAVQFKDCCWVADCDTCGAKLDDDEFAQAHRYSRGALTDEAEGWTFTEAGQAYCEKDRPAPAPLTLPQVRARLAEIAPPLFDDSPDYAISLARLIAVDAHRCLTRALDPAWRGHREWKRFGYGFAIVHLLAVLRGMDPDAADEAARVITMARDGDGDERLVRYLGGLGVDADEVSRLESARIALETAQAETRSEEKLQPVVVACWSEVQPGDLVLDHGEWVTVRYIQPSHEAQQDGGIAALMHVTYSRDGQAKSWDTERPGDSLTAVRRLPGRPVESEPCTGHGEAGK